MTTTTTPAAMDDDAIVPQTVLRGIHVAYRCLTDAARRLQALLGPESAPPTAYSRTYLFAELSTCHRWTEKLVQHIHLAGLPRNIEPLPADRRILVAFAGPAGAGKDAGALDRTLDTVIARDPAAVSRQLRFADALYDVMATVQLMLGLPPEKDRRFLQIVGTEWGRTLDPDLWVREFERRFSNVMYDAPTAHVFVTDVRFPNEVAALRLLGFHIVRIKRPSLVLDESFRGHPSEHGLDGIWGGRLFTAKKRAALGGAA